MDEFTIWNGVLSPTEIAGLYTSNSIPWVAPTIASAPRSGTAYLGEKYSLRVLASGTPNSFSYRWWKNATNAITDATNQTLVLSIASTDDAGDYTVVVSNAAGSITNSPAANISVLTSTNIVTGLSAYWSFNETTGTSAADSTGNGNDGTLFNFPVDNSQWVPGMFGKALNFRGFGTGMNDYVQVINQHVNPTRAMTVSTWVWVDSVSQWATIVKNWPGSSVNLPEYTNSQIHLGMESTAGDLSCYTFNPDKAQQIGPVREGASFHFPMSQWVHVAYACDGEMMRLYRNGAAIGTARRLPPMPTTGRSRLPR